MNPKEQAIKLKSKYEGLSLHPIGCALVSVDEIIEESSNYLNAGNWMLPSDREFQSYEDRVIFWNEVKTELENLYND